MASVPQVICERCGLASRVESYHHEASRLAAVGLVLGLNRPMDPYFVIDCPHCGERVQIAGPRKPLEPGA